MGLFSRKKHVGVASSIYNLAGDIDKRPDVLKATVLSTVLLEKPISAAISKSYLHGMGVRLRNFGKWAEDNFADVVGFSSGSIVSGHSIITSVLEGEITVPVGRTAKVQSSDIGEADFSYWADKYVADNYPNRLDTAYTVDMNEDTNQITISWEGGGTSTFTPSGFDKDADYLYASYYEVVPGSSSAVDTGATIILDPLDSFPSTVGWELVSTSTTTHTGTLDVTTTIDITYSDATPPSSSSSTSSSSYSYDEIHKVYEKYVTLSEGTGTTSYVTFEKSTMYQDTVGSIVTDTDVSVTTEDIGGGVIKTTTTTVVTESVKIERSYRIDTQEITVSGTSSLKIFIYKYGTGNATLDAMFNPPADQGSFMPFIPFRLNNYDVKDSFPSIYPQCAKAFKKATGAKYDKIRDNLLHPVDDDGNPKPSQIGDVDYCYAVFGVCLNTRDNAARKYLYNFFKMASEDAALNPADYDDWVAAWNAADAFWTEWLAWKATANSSESWSWVYSNPEPTRLAYPTMPQNSLKIGSTNPTMNYNITLKWNFIEEETLAVPPPTGRKVGDYWFGIGTSVTFDEQSYTPYDDGGVTAWRSFLTKENVKDVIYLYWQEDDNVQKKMTIVGLTHTNLIYGGKSVFTRSKDALQDLVTKEQAWVVAKAANPHSLATIAAKADLALVEESGLIIPLHRDVYKATGLVADTQIGTACCYLVFNCYEVVKEKWYQTSFFRFILIVVAVVITVVGGSTLGAAGTPGAAVSTSLGLSSGTAALVVTIAVNVIAMTVLTKIFTKVATELFGEKVGAIIGTIAAMFAFAGLGSFANGNGFIINFSEFLKADKLLAMTASVGNAYAGVLNDQTMKMQQELQQYQQKFEAMTDEITKMSAELFGTNGVLDPTEMAKILSDATETRDAFLQRTLMVGSDIANMSINLLNNFTEVTLSTDLP